MNVKITITSIGNNRYNCALIELQHCDYCVKSNKSYLKRPYVKLDDELKFQKFSDFTETFKKFDPKFKHNVPVFVIMVSVSNDT